MTETNVFVLTFYTMSGNTFAINVPRANKTLDAAAVEEKMLAIIESEAVMSSKGTLTAAVGAELVSTELVEC